MGFIVMLAVTLIVFFILKGIIGTLGSIILSSILLAVWFLVNIRAGSTGLIKANMRVYFVQRSRGASHKEALNLVIKSRYPFSQEKQLIVKDIFERTSPKGSEDSDLKALVYTIFSFENGSPPTHDWIANILRKIDNVYNSISRQYKI